jgi:hypothetical protein
MNEISDKIIVTRGLRRHGNHDTHRAARGLWPEQKFGIPFEQSRAFVDRRHAIWKFQRCLRRPGELIESLHYRLQTAYNVRLGAAKRRKAEGGELLLKVTDVVATKY